jgi:hypothetical protein
VDAFLRGLCNWKVSVFTPFFRFSKAEKSPPDCYPYVISKICHLTEIIASNFYHIFYNRFSVAERYESIVSLVLFFAHISGIIVAPKQSDPARLRIPNQ